MSRVEVTVTHDDCNRPDTTYEALAGMTPIMRFKKDGSDLNPNATVTAGNASQLSDGAAAQVVMEEKLAQQKGIEALGIFKGFGEKKHRHRHHRETRHRRRRYRHHHHHRHRHCHCRHHYHTNIVTMTATTVTTATTATTVTVTTSRGWV